MGSFNRESKFSRRDSGSFGRRDSGRSGGFRRRDSEGFGGDRGGSGRFERKEFGRPEMHTVVCDKCGETCEVPFKPTSSKPVYCSDCFRKGEGSGSSRRSEGSGNSQELVQINEKLDKIMKALHIE